MTCHSQLLKTVFFFWMSGKLLTHVKVQFRYSYITSTLKPSCRLAISMLEHLCTFLYDNVIFELIIYWPLTLFQLWSCQVTGPWLKKSLLPVLYFAMAKCGCLKIGVCGLWTTCRWSPKSWTWRKNYRWVRTGRYLIA